VVVVVVTTLSESCISRGTKVSIKTYVVVFTEGARYSEGRWWEVIVSDDVLVTAVFEKSVKVFASGLGRSGLSRARITYLFNI
jgi:hypothetical protein